MRNLLKHNLVVCLLCVTLLFTMGFGIETRLNDQAGTATRPTVEIGPKAPFSNSNQSALNQPELVTAASASLTTPAPSLPAVQQPEEQTNEQPANPKVTAAKYEVTAYYLNVRAEADGTSKIMNVVTQGTVLEVSKPTDNGWLELTGGGYIHGGYAKRISEEAKPSPQAAAVKAEEQAAGEAIAVQAPQPIVHAKPAEPNKPSSAVNSTSGLTEEQIAAVIKDTALEGEGLEEAILEIERMYGINSFFTIAVMKLESGHGKSQLARTKNNLFGLNAIDSDAYNKALSFKTKGESVKQFGHIISEFYFDRGLTSLEKVARKYCGANSNWPVLVKSIMNSDYKKVL